MLQGKHFSITDPKGVNTVIYQINKTEKEFLKEYPKYTVERLDFTEEIRGEATRKTFYVDEPQPNGNQLVILSFGKENVIYISGTDGFGSSTDEKYRKLFEAGEINSTLPEYVEHFHNVQKQTLQNYGISLNKFYASCLQPALKNHTEVSAMFFEKMLNNNKMQKKSTEQFFDTQKRHYLFYPGIVCGTFQQVRSVYGSHRR